MKRLNLCIGAVLVFLLGACASATVDPNAPEACVTIDNSRGGGAVGQVFLVKDGGERIRLGQVSMGRTMRQCIKRASLAGQYQIEVRQASSDRIDPALGQNQAPVQMSPSFRLSAGDEISWNVSTGRIRLLKSGGDR